MQQYDFVADFAYTSVVGNWKKVRNHSVDLRTVDASATQG
jgi:hypothetical protein